MGRPAKTEPDLDAAHALQTSGDSKRLFAGRAETSDSDFTARMDFVMPPTMARLPTGAGGAGPVLDAGAGTGLVEEALARLGVGPADALDISPQRLAVAARKGVRRALQEGDLTRRLHLPGLQLGKHRFHGTRATVEHRDPVANVAIFRRP